MGRHTKLDTSGRSGDVVVAANQAAEPLGQRIDDARGGDAGRDDDQHAITAVLPETGRPGGTGSIEGPLEDSVKFFTHEYADVVVTVRPRKVGDVDREQGAYLPAN